MKTTQLISNGGELQPAVCTAKKSNLVVLLDAGHWSGEKGKRSFDERFLEYEQNRIIQARVVEELKKLGIRYEIVTPEVDTYVSLTERCRRVNAYCDKYGTANCVCLSLHFNAFGSTWNDAKGYGVYTSPGKTASDAVAKIIDEEVDKIWVKQYHRVNRHMKEEAFTMVVKPKCRVCLLEQGFYTNKQEME